MEECIPRKVFSPRRQNLPWLSKESSDQCIKEIHVQKSRNRVVSELRFAKTAYFHKLNPSNSKQFWKAVKQLNKCSSSIPVLTHNNDTHDSDEAKANLLNLFFSSCFNDWVPPLHSLDCNLSALHHTPDILCTEKWVLDMLQSLSIAKACGHDGISVRMLKPTASAIAPSIIFLYNWVSHVLLGKVLTLYPFPRNRVLRVQMTQGQYPCYQSSARSWKSTFII